MAEIKPEQVPTECLIAFAEAHKTGGYPAGIAAALNAWPGMSMKQANDHLMLLNSTPALILPLTTQEPGDE